MEITQQYGSSTPRLARLEKHVGEMEEMAPKVTAQVIDELRDCLTNLLPLKLAAEERLQAWRLSYSIWNSCVAVANSLQPGQKLDEDHARLRQISSDLLFLAGNVDEIDAAHFKIAAFFYRTGVIWHSLEKFEQAAVCFEKVTEFMSKAQEEHVERNSMTASRSKEEQEFMFDLFVTRSRTAWELSQKALASSLSARARGLLSVLLDPERNVQLAEHYFAFGQSMLSKEDTESQTDAIKYLEQSFEIVSASPGPPNSSTSSSEDETGRKASSIIPTLKMKILRYLAAGHLQKENYESVMKCLAILKTAPQQHPSTAYIALKALAGLGRYEEAEKELFALVQDTATNAEACMSGIEIVLQEPNRLSAAKGAFLALQSRYPSDKSLPVRILECLLRRRLPGYVDATSKIKALDVVLDIASNEDVVATVTGVDTGGRSLLEIENSSSKEQECVHALLWNSGSEHFQAKQYDICIKLFEASMLYLPQDSGSNLQRAKSLRVLCLCRLALMQYERANEYVTEAEKVSESFIRVHYDFLARSLHLHSSGCHAFCAAIEMHAELPVLINDRVTLLSPQIDSNIACAFLKFKIHLQTKNEAAAAEQVEKMTKCPDFESEYLSLASHEAMTCGSTKIAISALSTYLNLPKATRTAGTRDVVVIRNIVSLALQSDEESHHMVVVKYLKEAQARLTDCGFDVFFGPGNVGQQEANWFAITSWNRGLIAIKQTLTSELAADYFSCAADFYGCLVESEENLRGLQQSLLLATSSLLMSTAGDECLRSASRMLDKCRKVQRALAMSNMDHSTDVADNSCEIHLSLLGFEIKGRNKDVKSQIDILHHCASLPGFEAKYFLHLAQQSSKAIAPGDSNNEVVITAYRLALKSILNSPSPDYKLVAAILRKLITLTDQHWKDGPQVMAVYKHAKEILAGLNLGEYPQEESQWLVATSWNRAGLQVKFLRFSAAELWMEMALDLANYDPHMENRKLSMIQSLDEVRQNKKSSIADGDL